MPAQTAKTEMSIASRIRWRVSFIFALPYVIPCRDRQYKRYKMPKASKELANGYGVPLYNQLLLYLGGELLQRGSE